MSATSVLTLSDLESGDFPGVSLAVLGHPIHHSLSPVMHQAALSVMAVSDPRFQDWHYHRFDVPPAQLAGALDRLHQTGFLGLNLTVPHKVLAFSLVAEIDASAQHIGAVNTLHRLPNGWRGYNTDGYGLRQALLASLGCHLADADIILLGAGGAARSAAAECLAARCRSLWIGNRTRDNLDALLKALRPLPGGEVLHGFDLSAPDAALPANAWVINSSSAGLRAEDASPIDLSKIPRPRGVFDMIYNPPETPLLREARILGIPGANGLGMLVHQGARALEIWSQADVPVEVMHAAISRR